MMGLSERVFDASAWRAVVWRKWDSPTVRFTALSLSVAAGSDGVVIKGVGGVKKTTGFSSRTIQRVFSTLIAAGLLEVIGRRFNAVRLVVADSEQGGGNVGNGSELG